MRVVIAKFNLENNGMFGVLVKISDDGSLRVMAKMCELCDPKPICQEEYSQDDWLSHEREFWGDWEEL